MPQVRVDMGGNRNDTSFGIDFKGKILYFFRFLRALFSKNLFLPIAESGEEIMSSGTSI